MGNPAWTPVTNLLANMTIVINDGSTVTITNNGLDALLFYEYLEDYKLSVLARAAYDPGTDLVNAGALDGVLQSLLADKWVDIFRAYFANYDPVENYNSTESKVTTDISRDRTDKIFSYNSTDGAHTTNFKETDKDDWTVTKKGNIGVTTTQQMIQQTVTLNDTNYISKFLEDIANILRKEI